MLQPFEDSSSTYLRPDIYLTVLLKASVSRLSLSLALPFGEHGQEAVVYASMCVSRTY